jgi:hypothetical protein
MYSCAQRAQINFGDLAPCSQCSTTFSVIQDCVADLNIFGSGIFGLPDSDADYSYTDPDQLKGLELTFFFN